MAKLTVPKAPEMKTTVYGNFKGVDYSTDASLVDRGRSPYAPNMISDVGGMPEKRLGWRTLHQLEQPINGLFYANIAGEDVYLVHAGTKIYKWMDTTKTLLMSDVNNGKSVAFYMRDKLFILTGANYLVFDGTNCSDATADATVPTILISKDPTGGGTALDPVNMIQPKRTERFLGKASVTTYQLAAVDIDATAVTAQVMGANGAWTTITEGNGLTVNRAKGQVTFSTAPGASPVEGVDNVYITYAKTVAGYADRIKKCTLFAYYGLGGSNRIFVSGNPDYKAYDFYCEINDPYYWPDMGYSVVGNESTAIMGYLRIGEYLAVVKEDNQQDTTIFLRSASMVDGKATFPLKQGISGTGAVSKYCFASLIDEPLFLARTGVYGLTSNIITAERTIQNRSYYVDNQLTKEPNLENAVACEWNGLYLVAINNRCYLLDGRQNKAYKAKSNDYVYECYQWENWPAVRMLSVEGLLYFGTGDGRICKLNTDIETMERFNDDDNAVVAAWSTKNDDDGATYLFKNLSKKGCLVTIKPYFRSSAQVLLRVDGEAEREIAYELMDIFSWTDIDFSRISFNSNESPQEVYFKTKVKKYKRLQIIIRNAKKSEGFGIFQIAKTFTTGNFSK